MDEARTDYLIREGDEVTVHFENVPWITGVVRGTPSATGDSWIIESRDEIHYVQFFSRMTKQRRSP